VAPSRVLLVVAHPAIASGLDTLLRLEGYDVKRVINIAEAQRQQEWQPEVVLVDGALMTAHGTIRIGAPTLVLSGNERDGRDLARKLDDPRGWLRKDATGAELSKAIRNALSTGAPEGDGLGTLAIAAIAVACLIALSVVAYLVWLALY
jgi:DNA-binding NarL/FixJ family response regulator